jgi:methionine sulfoxide reductase catalytic subunit
VISGSAEMWNSTTTGVLRPYTNGHPLPIPHGAPLRLRVETRLGFTMVKYIQAIEFIDDYHGIGEGQGGWREDHQYFSQEAGI